MTDMTTDTTSDSTTGEAVPRYDRAALLAKLDAMGFKVRTQEHAAVATVEEASAHGHDLAGAHTKNLFVKDKKGRVFLVTVPHDARADLKQLHKVIGAQGRLSFGKPEQLWDLLGVRPGSVTLFGAANDARGEVTVVVDRAIAQADTICAHPLENTATTAIARDDMMAFLRAHEHEPVVVDVPRAGDAADAAQDGRDG